MDFFKIIDQLAEVDADLLGRFDSRRAVFNSLGTIAKRTAMAATPVFLGSLFSKAYAGETGIKSTAIDLLNYALTLELLEADFYAQMITAGQIPAGTPAVAAIQKIKAHEDQHVALLGLTIRNLVGTPVSGVRFNPTAVANFTTDYDTQLLVAQVLEDTGVRAYKGRARELIGTDLLTTALRIHSMEARHAAHVRYMRALRAAPGTTIRPWIPASDSALPAPAGPAYTNGTTGTVPTTFTFGGGSFSIPAYDNAKPSPREDNTMQGATATAVAVDTTTALGNQYTAEQAAAAFDEYLQAAEVLDASRAGGLVM
ncbi:MAG: ferritin-like domain-containing protein [Bacteroidota bacterium]|nr:ferritin-like domain-containing protein [Bacteroidota bacterium]